MRSLLFAILALTSLCVSSISFAQAPDSLSFQGYVTNPGGEPINNSGASMIFKLYEGSSEIWSENQSSVNIEEGVFNVLLGSVTPLDTVRFNRPLSLGITVGGDLEISPRTPLASTAYALGMRGMYTVWADDGFIEGYNVIGGYHFNFVTSGIVGATISGGGGWWDEPKPNIVSGHWGTIGGGANNEVSEASGTVSGGWGNTAGGPNSTVGGGRRNSATGQHSTIAGGWSNLATGNDSAIPGGFQNAARGYDSFAAGRYAKAIHEGAFVWSDRSKPAQEDSLHSTGPNQFLIRAAGGVGIGTNSPANQLTVVGTVDITGKVGIGTNAPLSQLHLDNSNGSANGLKIESNEGDQTSLYYSANKGLVMDVYRPTDSRRLDLLFQPNGGNVGIGTLTPGFLLEVNGAAGKPGGGSWSTASDERLKDVEGPFERGLEALATLKPVAFQYKEDNPQGLPSDESYIGLIAQAVKQTIPEAVTRDDAGYLHLNNDPIIWTMLNAINELREQNEDLQAETDRLRLIVEGGSN